VRTQRLVTVGAVSAATAAPVNGTLAVAGGSALTVTWSTLGYTPSAAMNVTLKDATTGAVVLTLAYGVAVTIDAVLGNGIRVVRRLRGGTGDGR
jgi:hypothetical protein